MNWYFNDTKLTFLPKDSQKKLGWFLCVRSAETERFEVFSEAPMSLYWAASVFIWP